MLIIVRSGGSGYGLCTFQTESCTSGSEWTIITSEWTTSVCEWTIITSEWTTSVSGQKSHSNGRINLEQTNKAFKLRGINVNSFQLEANGRKSFVVGRKLNLTGRKLFKVGRKTNLSERKPCANGRKA